jgi:predicted  nucleic acid-binding Zn-ribbon protein
MDVITIVSNLTQLQKFSRSHEPLTAGQRLTVTRIRRETPSQVLAHFDGLLSRDQKGVAEVHNGVCNGCYLRLPTSVTHGPMDELVVCETCGAYLSFADAGSPSEMALASR